MFVLFEDAGKFLAGRVLSETDASAQVELESGKRVKAKLANVLLRFEKPQPAELLREAQLLAEGIELDLAWEFAPEEEFGFAELAREYFSAQATPVQQAAALLRLFESPHYFRRAGRGRFRKASAEILQQALAAIEKKKQLQAQISAWAAELVAGSCPPPIREQLYRILFKPDKNAPEYKAVVEASRNSHVAPLALLQRAGAITSSYQFHWRRFLLEYFPKGTGFPPVAAPAIREELPLAPVQAFSVDDSSTTEIDDALSVQGLAAARHGGRAHRRARPGDQRAAAGPARAPQLSTVYMRGQDHHDAGRVGPAYTDGGPRCPPVLYVQYDEASLEPKASEDAAGTRDVAVNCATPARCGADRNSCMTPAPRPTRPAGRRLPRELCFLYRLAKQLKAQREVIPQARSLTGRLQLRVSRRRGRAARRRGVEITVRRRGAPLD